MFGLDLLGNVVRKFFRDRAKAEAMRGTLEGIADALEDLTGERPALPGDAKVIEAAPVLPTNGRRRTVAARG